MKSVSPGDVVSTSVGVLHVQTVVMERSREDVSFAMSGVDGRGVVHSNIPIGEGMVPLAADVSDGEALVWFEREYKYGYFKVVDNKLKTGVVLYGGSGLSDRKGLIYDTDRGCVYLRIAVGGDDLWVPADTVKLLPVSSFEDIDSYVEWSEYKGVSLPGALRDIFLDMFAAGEGKPKCLPARDELWRGEWTGDYGRCRGRMLEVTSNMLFDIEKSVGYVRWLREQLVGFYRELGFTI